MDCVALLRQAHAAGLTVTVSDDRVVVRGPRCAEPIAKQLLDRKGDVLLWLWIEGLSPARRAEFEERAAIRQYDGGQCREAAELDAIREIRARMRAAAEHS